MTLPIPAYEFQHLFHTRRTVLQRFLLLPDAEARNLYRYTLARALSEPNRPMQLHAAVQMSNHVHEVFFDRRGADSDYRSHKNSVLARALNTLRGIKGRVFDTPTRRDRENLLDQAAVLAAIVYRRCALSDNQRHFEQVDCNRLRGKGLNDEGLAYSPSSQAQEPAQPCLSQQPRPPQRLTSLIERPS